jgi:hypothetical protein
MGNEYQQGNPVEYPAGFYEVIGVGQINSSLRRVSTSNTGSHIDVSAPGSYNTTSRNNGYASLGGTSSATPVVSGVAGLVISQGLDRGFSLTNDDVKHILDTTADDIEFYGTRWDEETGNGKVNAYNALQLLDEPNELYHYTSTGGASVKIQTLDQWILTDGRWGLAPGTYLSVDQYKITRHVNFNIPFCSPPKVWMRERQSKSLSYGNPNNGRPFCIITNVSNTGFDIEYATYYVRYNLLGQTLNTWVPSAPASTSVAYTAVGEPNLAAIAGPVTGPFFVCSSGASFTVNNLPTRANIVWNQGPYLTRTSEQGSNPCTFTSTGSGSSWVRATLITDCGSVTLTDKPVWAGTPVISSVSGPTSTPNNQWAAYYAQPNNPAMGVSDYSWTLNPMNGNSVYDNGWTADIAFYNAGNYQLVVRGQNTCGWGNYTVTGIEVYDSEGLSIFPNPAAGEVTLTIETSDEKEPSVSGWDLEIYAPNMMLKEKKTSLKDNKTIINTSGWQEGIYMVRVKYGENLLTGKLVVKR